MIELEPNKDSSPDLFSNFFLCQEAHCEWALATMALGLISTEMKKIWHRTQCLSAHIILFRVQFNTCHKYWEAVIHKQNQKELIFSLQELTTRWVRQPYKFNTKQKYINDMRGMKKKKAHQRKDGINLVVEMWSLHERDSSQ